MKVFTCTLFLTILSAGAFATQDKKTLIIRLQSPTGNNSDATMYFDQGVNPLYNIHEDAEMVFNNLVAYPELYSMTTDKVPCSTNGCGDLSTATVISLGYHAGFSGLYNISAIQYDNFDPTSIIQLEDRQTGMLMDLRENFYQVQLDSNGFNDDRFFIHVSTPVQFSSTPSNCANTGGQIFVTPDSSIHWNLCQLYDANNKLVASDSNVNAPVAFNALSAGNYQVSFTFNQYTTPHNFQLSGYFVVATINTPGNYIYTDESVVFSAQTTNADQYSWDFGDGSLVTGIENAAQTYFKPGTYTVSLSCGNIYGCSASTTASITVEMPSGINGVSNKDISITAYSNTIQVNMNGELNSNAHLTVFNLLGQPVLEKDIAVQKEQFELGSQPTGYYLVSIKNEGNTSTKRVFINQP